MTKRRIIMAVLLLLLAAVTQTGKTVLAAGCSGFPPAYPPIGMCGPTGKPQPQCVCDQKGNCHWQFVCVHV